MKKFLLAVFVTFALMVMPVLVQIASAQPPPPKPKPIPIDGGLTVLIVAGAAYGARKIYKASKNQNETE